MKRSDLDQIVTVINNTLKRNGSDQEIWIGYAMRQPRVYQNTIGSQNIQEKELSPRLPKSDLYWWLMAFNDGLDLGLQTKGGAK